MAGATDWGMRIKLARVGRGLTQKQLADAAGMHQANVSKIENGQVVPSTATADRLMAAMEGGPIQVPTRRDNGKRQWATLPGGELHELDVAAMMGTEATPVDWIVDGMVARRAVTMIAGREGQGKSLLMQALSVGMVEDHRKVAGLEARPGRVWIIDAENGPQLLHRRLVALGLTSAGAGKVRLWDAQSFDLSRDRALIMEQLERAEHRPDLLVLDSFKSLWHGSENNPLAVAGVLNDLREIARMFDLGVAVIHHTTKVGDTYRGSSAIGATIEAVFTFSRPKGVAFEESPLRQLRCRKMRLGAELETHWLRITGSGRIAPAEAPDAEEEPME